MNWIRVSDRAPQPYCDVLVAYDAAGISDDGYAVDIGYLTLDGFRLLWGEEIPVRVTHWMPLPQPPHGAVVASNAMPLADGGRHG